MVDQNPLNDKDQERTFKQTFCFCFVDIKKDADAIFKFFNTWTYALNSLDYLQMLKPEKKPKEVNKKPKNEKELN